MEYNTDDIEAGPSTTLAGAKYGIAAGLLLVGLLLGWAYLNAVVRFDPQLWYLNWPPGAYSLTEFASTGLRGPLIAALLYMGFSIGVAKSRVTPALLGAAIAIPLILSGNAGFGRMIALQTGSAQVRCVVPQSRACQLNEFNRRYDLQERSLLSEADSVRHAQYSALREQARVERPPAGDVLPGEMERHQRELRQWEQRFKPELDALFGPEPPANS